MTLHILWTLGLSGLFLVGNVAILCVILYLNRRKEPPSAAQPIPPGQGTLEPSDILGWEFDYARATASESMEQRHTLVNFYLLAAGIVASGVVGILSGESKLSSSVGTALLWLLCAIGWVYFLSIIRLRQAWHDSARAMNQIKDFYIQHAAGFQPEALRQAFRWQSHTLPQADKPWTVFFYSAMVIALLDSAAYTAGSLLLDLPLVQALPWLMGPALALCGLALFAFHVRLYFAFLRK